MHRLNYRLAGLLTNTKPMLGSAVAVIDKNVFRFIARIASFKHVLWNRIILEEMTGDPKCHGRRGWIFPAHMFEPYYRHLIANDFFTATIIFQQSGYPRLHRIPADQFFLRLVNFYQ